MVFTKLLSGSNGLDLTENYFPIAGGEPKTIIQSLATKSNHAIAKFRFHLLASTCFMIEGVESFAGHADFLTGHPDISTGLGWQQLPYSPLAINRRNLSESKKTAH